MGEDEVSHFQNEKIDSSGKIIGSYGYRDSKGLFRKVEYIADDIGFHANVNTNESGTDSKVNPANVQMNDQPSPYGYQAKHFVGMIFLYKKS